MLPLISDRMCPSPNTPTSQSPGASELIVVADADRCPTSHRHQCPADRQREREPTGTGYRMLRHPTGHSRRRRRSRSRSSSARSNRRGRLGVGARGNIGGESRAGKCRHRGQCDDQSFHVSSQLISGRSLTSVKFRIRRISNRPKNYSRFQPKCCCRGNTPAGKREAGKSLKKAANPPPKAEIRPFLALPAIPGARRPANPRWRIRPCRK